MNPLHFSIIINAPKEKVWDTMLGDATYRQWTSVFNEHGSSYEGTWEQGSKMRFIGPDDKGNVGGMVSMIAENRPHEFLSIQHIGLINEDGSEDTTSEKVKGWAGAFENYTFKDVESGTEVLIDLIGLDTDPDFVTFFKETWPKGLAILKELAEK